MNKVFVNGLNSKSGGGKSILTNFLSILSKTPRNERFYVLVPNSDEYSQFKCDYIQMLVLPPICSKGMAFPLVNRFILPKLVDRHDCDLVFNLSDIPIPTNIKQVFLFDWSYAVFPDSPVWKMMDIKSYIVRKAKLFYFKRYLKYVDLLIAQSAVMKSRLEKIYDFSSIEVVANAVSLENLKGGSGFDFKLDCGLNLLYLTQYYPHKNLEILLPLAKKIITQQLEINIITTVSPCQHIGAKRFLRQVQKLGLSKVIHNVGPVSMADVPSLYLQTDGLLMPTLLESFSGAYVEAMYHGKPIFTSDLDFATGVCKEAAYYFDPFDADQILEKILECLNNPLDRENKIKEGKKTLDQLLTWEQAFQKYISLFEKAGSSHQ